MDVRFGLALDGAPAQPAVNRLGYACVGPLGMLSILEGELGLTATRVDRGTRVAQYHACLKACNNSDRFFFESFEADPLGVSRKLLEWRDAWYLAGWSGGFSEQSPSRLQDMVAVEEHASIFLEPGVGERLALVIKALKNQRTQITSIELVDDIETFPFLWRQVLEKLDTRAHAVLTPYQGSSDLSRLQKSLMSMLEGNSESISFAFTNDASVRILGSDSRTVLARYLTAIIRENPAHTVIVGAQDSSLLDEVIAASGAPCAGMKEASPLLPALQLLPLTLGLMWNPLDVTTLLEFLTHPMTPIDKSLARDLARLVSKSPGVGGSEWNEILAKDPFLNKKDRQPASFWLMSKRYSRSAGLPVADVSARLQALADSHSRRLAILSGEKITNEDLRLKESVAMAYAQCKQFLATLDLFAKTGQDTLTPRNLQQMYDLAASGVPAFGNVAEVGHTPFVTDPTSLVEHYDTVIWWQMCAPRLPQAYPWSVKEMEAMSSAGIRLPSHDQQLQWMTRTWLRPLLSARSKLILVLPPSDEERHPVLQFIYQIAKGLETHVSDDLNVVCQEVAMLDVTHKPLPALKRWWHLPETVVIPKRETESASSLGILFDSPYQWVLRYPARLRESEILALPDGPTLYGVLLHRLMELYFRSEGWADHDLDAIDRWFGMNFEILVEAEGQTLHQPGRQAELAKFRDIGRRALHELIAQIKAAKVVSVKSESPVQGEFKGGKIAGTADMIVTKSNGQTAIIDLKWSDYADKYTQLLATNQHLQLAIYAQLLSRKAGGIELAYYILSRAKLIAQKDDFFPEAVVVQNRSDENILHLWQRFEESWRWRRGQLDGGRVEVVTEQTEMDVDSSAPEDALKLNTPNDRYNSYLHLAGWGRQA